MSALEQLDSVDRALAEMRRKYEDEKKSLQDDCMMTKVENEILKASLAEAIQNGRRWERVATQLVTQFDMVEKIFADVKGAAMTIREQNAMDEQQHEQDQYQQDQDAGNANALSSDTTDTGNVSVGPMPSILTFENNTFQTTPAIRDENGTCNTCGALANQGHAINCIAVDGNDPPPIGMQDNQTEPADNAKLDPEFVVPPAVRIFESPPADYTPPPRLKRKPIIPNGG